MRPETRLKVCSTSLTKWAPFPLHIHLRGKQGCGNRFVFSGLSPALHKFMCRKRVRVCVGVYVCMGACVSLCARLIVGIVDFGIDLISK